MPASPEPIRVFISYSHDSTEHMEKVLELADKLRENGIDASIDQYELAPLGGWARWTEAQIRNSDFVIVVCTSVYLQRAEGREEPGKGLGASWESSLCIQQVYQAAVKDSKFIPALLDGASPGDIPWFLQGRSYHFVSTPDGYEQLYRQLTNQPFAEKPDLGKLKSLPPRQRRSAPFPSVPAPPVVPALPPSAPAPLPPAPAPSPLIISQRPSLAGIGSGPGPGNGMLKISTPARLVILMVVVLGGILICYLNPDSVVVQSASIAALIVLIFKRRLILSKEISAAAGAALLKAFWILCIVWLGLAIFLAKRAIYHAYTEHALVKLTDQLGSLRQRYSLLAISPGNAIEVNRDAAKLSQDIFEIDDSGLSAGMRIFKYQSIAYTRTMVAGTEMIAEADFQKREKLDRIDDALHACQEARDRIEAALNPVRDDPESRGIIHWIKNDYAEARVQRLKAVALCFRWQLNHDDNDRATSRQIIDGLPGLYLTKEHPENSRELAPCLKNNGVPAQQ